MASLFSMASLVSAGFVEEVFSEVCELMTTSSSGTSDSCNCNSDGVNKAKCASCGVEYIQSYYCTKCGQVHLPIGIPEHTCS